MRALFSYGLALVIVVVVAAWLATGTLVTGGKGPGNGETPIIQIIEGKKDGPVAQAIEPVLAEPVHAAEGTPDPELTIAERQEESSGEAAPLRSVRVKTFVAQALSIEVPLRGQTKAKSTVTAAAETTGIVARVSVTKGQWVKLGDALCTLDQGTRQAAVDQAMAGLAQANASLSQAQADFDTNAELREKGLAASNTGRPLEVALEAAKAAVTSAQSGLDNAREELKRTQVVAKSDGVVQDPLASVGSMLAAGQPCATIVKMDPLVFAGNVPEAHIGLARLGLEASIVTVTGQTLEGKVTYIASVADPATRSFPVEIEVPNPGGKLLAGVSATATVKIGVTQALLLPQSVLTLDDDGTIGIRAVENGVVAFYPVTIAKDSREGVWVTGLPPKLDVITVGQEYVEAGQKVNASQAEDSANAGKAEGA